MRWLQCEKTTLGRLKIAEALLVHAGEGIARLEEILESILAQLSRVQAALAQCNSSIAVQQRYLESHRGQNTS